MLPVGQGGILTLPDPGPKAAQPGAREQRRAGTHSNDSSQVVAVFAGSATAGRILPAMHSSDGYHGFRTAPIPAGWVQTGERWALWYTTARRPASRPTAVLGSGYGWKARRCGR